ncbi:hypothetical protein BDQ94DRAFT_155981 [Aspergillus welwitschiae]|uniref:Uncharacterized protein n=1 Tax=Aspergillus welwitschiae TaxID=1341132 RepID=A0A3F3PGR1_9EURO|nr:hypothetical protein BDQ94DRAFT_155981 [Aspergillus welwitschiae]RDH26110.1 hypothetical protein BDQ94DRAFT_155981 [Aspergillus welwitschiae]
MPCIGDLSVTCMVVESCSSDLIIHCPIHMDESPPDNNTLEFTHRRSLTAVK